MTNSRRWRGIAGALLLLVSIGSFVRRDVLLRSVGQLLIVDEPLKPADVAVMTTEAHPAGEIDLADLLARHTVRRVAVLIPALSATDRELVRRGVAIAGPAQLLANLGVSPENMELIPAGEGGTTESTAALAAWCRRRDIHAIIVVTAPNHTRRVKRALSRAFKSGGPEVRLHATTYDTFHAGDWWRRRGDLRSGIVELQKLLLDFAQHPFSN